LTDKVIYHHQNNVDVPVSIDVEEGNRVRPARDGQKRSRPKRTVAGIQEHADIVQALIGDNYVRLTISIQICDADLMVLAEAGRTTKQDEKSREKRLSKKTHIHLLWSDYILKL
jgi:hypothetical protein